MGSVDSASGRTTPGSTRLTARRSAATEACGAVPPRYLCTSQCNFIGQIPDFPISRMNQSFMAEPLNCEVIKMGSVVRFMSSGCVGRGIHD